MAWFVALLHLFGLLDLVDSLELRDLLDLLDLLDMQAWFGLGGSLASMLSILTKKPMKFIEKGTYPRENEVEHGFLKARVPMKILKLVCQRSNFTRFLIP